MDETRKKRVNDVITGCHNCSTHRRYFSTSASASPIMRCLLELNVVIRGFNPLRAGGRVPQSLRWASIALPPKLIENTGHVGHVPLFSTLDLQCGSSSELTRIMGYYSIKC